MDGAWEGRVHIKGTFPSHNASFWRQTVGRDGKGAKLMYGGKGKKHILGIFPFHNTSFLKSAIYLIQSECETSYDSYLQALLNSNSTVFCPVDHKY